MSIPTIGFSKQNGTTTFDPWYKLSEKAIVSEDGPSLAFKILLPVLFACGITSLGFIYWEFSNVKEDIDANEEEQEETVNSQEAQAV